jgi:hypothetical protein
MVHVPLVALVPFQQQAIVFCADVLAPAGVFPLAVAVVNPVVSQLDCAAPPVVIFFGAETGNDALLKQMDKGGKQTRRKYKMKYR